MQQHGEEARAFEEADTADHREWRDDGGPDEHPWSASPDAASAATTLEMLLGFAMALLVLGAMAFAALALTEEPGTRYLAAAIFLGLLARVAQAERHHIEMRRRM